MLGLVLSTSGHQVLEASNGKLGYDAFVEHHPDLVLMDVQMPVMDGLQSTKAIREYLGEKHTPILFLTGQSDDDTLSRCLAIGGDDFLYKPVSSQVLVAKIDAHSRIKELNDQINHQNKLLLEHSAKNQREQKLAKTVFENAMGASVKATNNLRHYQSPASTFSGDIVLSAVSPSGGLYVLLADFTGHGLASAIGGLPMSHIFYEATNQGDGVSDIARKINQSLTKFLPDHMFAACTILELNAGGNRVTIWTGGLPEILHLSADGKLKQTISSQNMALGFLDDEDFKRDLVVQDLAENDKLYLYTDGITEARNEQKEFFGGQRLYDLCEQPQDDLFHLIIDNVNNFSGNQPQKDDFTLVELTCVPVNLGKSQVENKRSSLVFPWSLSIEFDHQLLKSSNPVSQISDILATTPGLKAHKDILHTIVSELFTNSLEHGVLKLDSALKSSSEGYLNYYQLRDQKLKQLDAGFIRLQLECRVNQDSIDIHIKVADSGDGFNLETLPTSNKDDFFGRGITLIKSFCSEVRYSPMGNSVEVIYSIANTS